MSNDNRSEEHILPNSIGGRLKSADLLCRTCNEQTGQLFDDVFAEFALALASKYNIRRDRGKVQNFKAVEKGTGLEVIVRPGYQVDFIEPRFTEVGPGRGLLVANNLRRFRHAMEQIKKKKLEEGYVIEFAPTTYDYSHKNVDFVFELSINHEALLRSVCKTVCNFYIYKTNDRVAIEPLIGFLKEDEENYYSWFCDLGLVNKHFGQQPFHVLIIKGDKRQGAVYGYLEIFGEKGFVVLINGRYDGGDFLQSYTFDPVNRVTLDAAYDFQLKVGELIRLIQHKPGLRPCWGDGDMTP